jgi:hypothetical protein
MMITQKRPTKPKRAAAAVPAIPAAAAAVDAELATVGVKAKPTIIRRNVINKFPRADSLAGDFLGGVMEHLPPGEQDDTSLQAPMVTFS